MPFFIYPPGYANPYVLDDEDSHFLHYFSLWGWRWEYRPLNDPQVIRVIENVAKSSREPLYNVWEKECRRRIKAENKRIASDAKAMKDTTKQARKEAVGKPSLKKRVSKMFGKKSGEDIKDVEVNRYKNGVYMNHLEDLQKKWSDEDERAKEQDVRT